VLLYEMLAGYPPFCADSPLAVFELALHAEPTFPPHVPAHVESSTCAADWPRMAETW